MERQILDFITVVFILTLGWYEAPGCLVLGARTRVVDSTPELAFGVLKNTFVTPDFVFQISRLSGNFFYKAYQFRKKVLQKKEKVNFVFDMIMISYGYSNLYFWRYQ